MEESFYLIAMKYDLGVYTIKEVFDLVEQKVITEQQFFEITRCSYQGIKKMKGW